LKNLLLIIFIPLIANSQNLISDPSFEYIEKDTYWVNPSTTTPDHHSPENPGWWIQSNPVNPYDGKGYFHLSFGSSNHEYIQSKLKEKLKKGHLYCAMLYAMNRNTENNNNVTIKWIGMAITKKKLNGNPSYMMSNKKGNLKLSNDSSLLNHNSWVSLCDTFRAKGGEEYVTIGSFGKNEYLNLTIDSKTKEVHCSYFIDYISLKEISVNKECNCSTLIRYQNEKTYGN
jgi:hypothetical protein